MVCFSKNARTTNLTISPHADEDGDEDMEFVDGNMDDLDFLDDIASPSPDRGGAPKKGLKFADELNADSQDDDDK